MLIFWILVFIASLALLIKGADWFVESSEKIGIALGVSPFIIGVTVVGLGTSFPELISALAAVFKGATEIVAANVVGSNIANILLIVGLSAIATKKFLAVRRSLIDIDLPLLASVTVLFGFILWDGNIIWQEGALLLTAFLVYLFYVFSQRRTGSEGPIVLPEALPSEEPLVKDKILSQKTSKVLPSRADRRKVKKPVKKLNFQVFFFLILGVVFLVIGANYLIDSVIKISEILKIGISVITIFGVSVGTSLPELVVSIKAAIGKKYEIALGSIFGSNVFNALLVAGLPAMFKPLVVDEVTLFIGFPFMVMATLLLVISGITRRISVWEGAMFLLIYVLFVVKLFGLF